MDSSRRSLSHFQPQTKRLHAPLSSYPDLHAVRKEVAALTRQKKSQTRRTGESAANRRIRNHSYTIINRTKARNHDADIH
jgi:hypothetical protein